MQPISVGHFDPQGHPCVKVSLSGVKHHPPGIDYEAMIDTGFSGFIQVPTLQAIALQLPLEGTQTLTLADGRTIVAFTALVNTTLADRTTTGVAVLSPSDKFLVGMRFLRQFDRQLVVSKHSILLVSEPPAPQSS